MPPERDSHRSVSLLWPLVATAVCVLIIAWALSGCISENRRESQGAFGAGVGGVAGAGWLPVGGAVAPGGAGLGLAPPAPGQVPTGDPNIAQCVWPHTAHCDRDLYLCEPLDTLRNCGFCGNRCAIPGARVTCRNLMCEFIGCNRNRGDCDLNPFNGCETLLLRDPFNCGACGISCMHLPGAVGGRCEDGECVVSACLPGLGDCNEEPQDGCETHLGTQEHCGACDRRCGDRLTTAVCQPTPTGGVCQFLGCAPGAADCRGRGQCVSLSSSEHCGRCDNPCPRGTRCQNGLCV